MALRPTQRNPSGLVCYRLERRIGRGATLVAENLAALDLLFPLPVIRALALGLERVAVRQQCDRIRFVCRENDRPALQALREMGNGSLKEVLVTRPVGTPATNGAAQTV